MSAIIFFKVFTFEYSKLKGNIHIELNLPGKFCLFFAVVFDNSFFKIVNSIKYEYIVCLFALIQVCVCQSVLCDLGITYMHAHAKSCESLFNFSNTEKLAGILVSHLSLT